MRELLVLSACALAVSAAPAAAQTTHTVGPSGRDFTTLRDALAAAGDGDTIEIDAGEYAGDGGRVDQDDLTIRGVGGLAHLNATGASVTDRKGILVINGDRVTIEGLELSGAAVSATDGCNGAGIRHQGGDLTIRDSVFRDNENGILGSPGSGFTAAQVLIERSEFDQNGSTNSASGCQGYSHGIYLNRYARVTVQYSYFHRARFGHELKSRAEENFILYNRFANEGGNASREVELTEGGLGVVIGNVIHQSPTSPNRQMLAFAMEADVAPMQLYAVNNTFVNDATGGDFVRIGRAGASGLVANNLFVGPGTTIGGEAGSVVEQTNLSTDAPMFVDRAGGDFHLSAGSPAVDAGSDPGSGGGTALAPTRQHVMPTGSETRPSDGTLDVGAFEHGVAPPEDGGVPMGDAGPLADGGPASGDGGRPPIGDAGAVDDGGLVGHLDGGAGGDDEGGCGCRAAGAKGRSGAPLALALAALLALARHRRR